MLAEAFRFFMSGRKSEQPKNGRNRTACHEGKTCEDIRQLQQLKPRVANAWDLKRESRAVSRRPAPARRAYLAVLETANWEMVSVTRFCWSAVSPANIGRDKISSAAASVSGKSPRFHPMEA